MFYIIRLVIACIAVLLALLFTKHTKNRKRIVAIVLVMVAVLYQLSVVFPIEQIHKYDNVEEVFDYMYSGNIDFIEYGQDSALPIWIRHLFHSGRNPLPIGLGLQ